MTHSPKISHIDTVRAYYSGPRIIVEVDIVMNPDESLRATHDVAEELQSKLESLPDVERAYVHVDYETSHKPVCPYVFCLCLHPCRCLFSMSFIYYAHVSSSLAPTPCGGKYWCQETRKYGQESS